jgi:hypothetical protein
MRKLTMIQSAVALLSLLLAPAVLAQWGAIQSGVEAVKGAKKAQEPAKKEDSGGAMNLAADEKKPTFTAATTLRNNARQFSITVPAGWQ